jgi:mannose-6-phosphate isomerase-like protein (cupin superfamily)
MTPSEARRLGWHLAARYELARRHARFGGQQLLKDAATRSPYWYRVACRREVLDLVTDRLGPNVLLWGASLVIRPPGHRHGWHVDVETAAAPPGRTVSVWIPLHGGGPGSDFESLPGSHLLAASVQEHCATTGIDPAELDTARVEELAASAGAARRAERLVAHPGEAVVFDGKLWHSTRNESSSTRRALLLQYATPDTHILTPDPSDYSWPFRQADRGASCVLVSGSDRFAANDVVPPPSRPPRRRPQLDARIEPIDLGDAPTDTHQASILFDGPTATGLHMIAHVSMLAKDHTPHPPHTHQEEEVLVVLRGRLAVHLVDEPGSPARVEQLAAGGILHYPLDQLHTITGQSDEAARYVILKWRSHRISRRSNLLGVHLAERVDPDPVDGRLAAQVIFEGSTRYLRRLHCHRSTVPPGGGYEPHADAYDVAIVTLDGTIETLGERVGPNSLVWYPMGSSHGLRNVGDDNAHYVVFEFHGANIGSLFNPHRFRAAARQVALLPVRVVRRLVRGIRR